MILHAVLASALLLSPGAPADAVSCTGTSVSEINMGGKPVTQTESLPQQIYVVDAGRNQVRHALLGKREYEDLCAVALPTCDVGITSRQVYVRGTKRNDKGTTSLLFDLDRATGAGRFELRLAFDGGRYVNLIWTMTCKPTEAPVF